MAFIFAGYTGEMQRLLDANEGMRSRIPENNHFTFPDYSGDELFAIAKAMLKTEQFKLDNEAETTLRQVIEIRSQSRNFGNARGVRNLVDELHNAQSAAWFKDRTIDAQLISAATVRTLA